MLRAKLLRTTGQLMLSVDIRPAREGDHDSIRKLLEQSGLPTDDLESAAPEFVVAVHGGKLIGVGALQRFADTALLRSVVVLPEERGKGRGQQIVAELERTARQRGVRELALLTQTAADFFGRLGYRTVERSTVLGPICNSAEFRSLCPASAVCMSKTLSVVENGGMSNRIYNVLFLCTGNSARSILAESLINHWGKGRFRGFSAGSHPKGAVHSMALTLLQELRLPTQGLRSKSWDEFAEPGAPPLDFVLTVCDNAAGEVCPYWPGHPITAHWGVPDPAAVQGSESQQWAAFREAFRLLENRIKLFVSLPIETIDPMKLKQHLDAIGSTEERG